MNETELELKVKEYEDYINEHISNVKVAYMQYGDKLCKALNISPIVLLRNVNAHDKSKWSEEEFDAYRQYFHPCSDETPNKEWFNMGWVHHQNNNPHHPEYWIDRSDDGKILTMPPVYIAEMLLDWQAMKIKFGGNNYDYYMQNRDKKPFSEETKKILDEVIKIFK